MREKKPHIIFDNFKKKQHTNDSITQIHDDDDNLITDDEYIMKSLHI